MVVIRDKYWASDSFVKLGPLKALENRHGENAICVVDDDDIGIEKNSASRIKTEILNSRLNGPLLARLAKTREPSTFDPNRSGHVIKLMVGLIQEYGALTIDELASLLDMFKANNDERLIRSYLLCAESVSWIVGRRKGIKTYYFAYDLRDAAAISWNGEPDIKNRRRRRLLIREYWKTNDELRFNGIVAVCGGYGK